MKTPYDKLAIMYTTYFGHTTKMTATPIYGKKIFENLPLQNLKACDLEIWYVALACEAYQGCTNDDPKMTLTYLTSRSNLLPNAL